jgi:hypothetical protein
MTGLVAACFLVLAGRNVLAQIPDYPDEEIADIPVNYTEAKVGDYTLPDPLKMADGSSVADAEAWRTRRRPELVTLFEENQFGRAPAPRDVRFEVVEPATPAFDGKAIRKQVTIHFGEGEHAQSLDLLIYLPPDAAGPVPLLLNVGFAANNLAADDPGVKVGRVWNRQENKRTPAEGGPRFGRLNVMRLVERGYGIATFNYADVEPDAIGAFAGSVRKQYLAEGQTEPAANEWGAIAAWAWGVSRIIDYCETDPQIDAKRIAITGVSRLGKTVMWAGARDERVALVLASCSGEGGAALSRRNYGETIAHLVAPSRFPFWYAKNYDQWAADPNTAPIDAHGLIALIAPRPVLLQTGNGDKWSDPKGEFDAAVAATPVYKLLGQGGVDATELPAAGELAGDTLAFYMHDGGHGMVPGDWDVFLDFMDKHLKPAAAQ